MDCLRRTGTGCVVDCRIYDGLVPGLWWTVEDDLYFVCSGLDYTNALYWVSSGL